jgi:hypothetical protein
MWQCASVAFFGKLNFGVLVFGSGARHGFVMSWGSSVRKRVG